MAQRIRANTWVSLGSFPFAGTPKISLSNEAADGEGIAEAERGRTEGIPYRIG